MAPREAAPLPLPPLPGGVCRREPNHGEEILELN